jgi:hypothetical protein
MINTKSLAKARGLTMRLLPLVLVVLVLALLGERPADALRWKRSSLIAGSRLCSSGKIYEFWTGMASQMVRVLEIRSDGWVQVQFTK